MPTAADNSHIVLLDTSAAVALILEDHDNHQGAVAACQGLRLGLAGHAWFETYSVLTRLPGVLRRSPDEALAILTRNFPHSVFLAEDSAVRLSGELPTMRVAGGAVYDALVAAAVRQHDRRLISADSKASATYSALQVTVDLI